LLVDTGGFEAEGAAGLDRAIGERSLAAVAAADVVVYVLDGKAGLSPADEAAARELRHRGANLLFVVNKLDSPSRDRGAGEFHRLGAGDLIPVSAEHGLGIAALVDAILARVWAAEPARRARAIRIGVVGRPNVGKSSLVNRLLGYPRALIDAEAGTTRDAVDTLLDAGGTQYLLVDTAGIRRRPRIEGRVERFAAGNAIHTLERSDVVVLVLDAAEGATSQDARLAALAWNAGCGVVVAANKWDLRTDKPAAFADDLRRCFPSLATLPILTVSALSGAGVDTILPAVRRVAAARESDLQTARLNEALAEAVRAKEPPLVRGRRPKIYYVTQTGCRPPEITIFCSDPTGVHPSYHRYLQKQIGAAFLLTGTPVRLRFRARR
jgi:GTP-binding protein